MDILKVEGLSKKYGKGVNEVTALDNVSFSVAKGSFVAIVGASGSGKSTLLHLIGGVDKPSSGTVYINNVNVYSQKDDELAIFRRREIGFVFQAFNLIPVLTAEENIAMPMLLDGNKADRELTKRISSLLDDLGLKDRRNHLPSELSGGQQQRVSIGRALVNKPALILADEPTGNLDSKNSRDILSILRYSVQKYNQTLILITHDREIASYADRIITLRDGKIVGDEAIR